MKKEQLTAKTKLQFTRKAVAKLNRTEADTANAMTTTTAITIALATLTQRCCGGEDSSRPVPSLCGGAAIA
jgi:hypothetical protein